MRASFSNVAARAARLLRRAARVLERVGGVHQEEVARTMGLHDMVEDPDDRYYLQQYLHWLRPVLEELRGTGARVVDLGCGQGRLALALAEELPDAAVTGVDLVPEAVAAATAYARARDIGNAAFETRDALEAVRELDEASVDLVVFTEVSFWMPGYLEVLRAAATALRPGGVLFAALRGQYHDLLAVVQTRNFESARIVRDRRQGQIHDGPIIYAWHTVDDIRREFGELGLTIETLAGIGVLSGLVSDPHSAVVTPSTLSAAQRADLLDVELSVAQRYAEAGRYILVVARRP
jgi:SAM-dependent methyltransferase